VSLTSTSWNDIAPWIQRIEALCRDASSIPRGILMAFLGPMPRLTDKNEIRTRLRRDPAWSVYALGDLAPPMFSKTLWFAPDLTLVVQDYGTAILFAMGRAACGRPSNAWPGPCTCRCSAAHWTKWHATRRCRLPV
jgi:hypothetical protein